MAERKETRTARFPREAVLTLLTAAAAGDKPVCLVKDQGAYLMTWGVDGDPSPVGPVYAIGHEAPPESGAADLAPESEWLTQRRATEQVWGGDDFALDFTVDQVRAVLGDGDLHVTTQLSVSDWPADAPADLWGRRDPIHHLTEVRLGAAEASGASGG